VFGYHALRLFLGAFLAVLLADFPLAFFAVFLTAFLAPLAAGFFFAVFLAAFLTAFFADLLRAFLAVRFGAARFLFRTGATAIGGIIMGSETRPSVASGKILCYWLSRNHDY
jgi:hypothetical protein